MDFIKPIQTEIITTITKAWQCSKCDQTFTKEAEAESHYARTHAPSKTDWIDGSGNILYFDNEYDFVFWKIHGHFKRSGGCGGAWQGSGWYIIVWRGEDTGEYPSLEPAWEALNLKLENAKYEYDQALKKIEQMKKILAS